MTAAPVTEDPRAGFLPWTPHLVRLLIGLVLAMFVSAMDSTVVATALPTISHELGGIALYPWVFTGYLLTSTTSVPVWGRLADLHGRRRVLLAGMALFVGASLLCGLSPGMPALVAFRALQGLGAGCLQPVTLTVVGDIFPLQQRARLQGFFSATWGVSAIIGPLIGAAFVSTIGWRWIFGINLPIGVLSAFLLFGYREHRPEARDGRLDLSGAAALTVGIALLLWGLGAGGSNGQVWPAVAAGAVAIAGAVLLERRSSHPTLPIDLFGHRIIGPAVLAATLAGAVMFGVNAYGPLYIQDGLGENALFEAGAAVAPIALGWPLASILSGRLFVRTGWRPLVAAGGGAIVLGSLLMTQATSTAAVGVAALVIGFGLGLLSNPTLIVIQASVPWNRRGAATALNQFSRTIGGAVGVSLLGILLQAQAGAGAHIGGAAVRAGAHAIFWVLLAVAGGTLATSVWILILGRDPEALPAA